MRHLSKAKGVNPEDNFCTADLARAELKGLAKVQKLYPAFLKEHTHTPFWFHSDCQSLSGSVGRHAVSTYGGVSALTTHVKIWDYHSRTLLSAEDGRTN